MYRCNNEGTIMQGFYDAHARESEIDMSGHDNDNHYNVDRRGQMDRRKRDRRSKKEDRKAASGNLLQPILTQAEIAVLLRGAR
jgi:hypothetical protein